MNWKGALERNVGMNWGGMVAMRKRSEPKGAANVRIGVE
jgi:hypothetical protein